MRICFFLFPFVLLSTPIKVPQEFYSGAGLNGNDPGYAPLIADRTFRAICDHIIDQDAVWFDPAKVKPGDMIYLNLWYIQWFETQVHDQIRCPYILVSCDVGDWFPESRYQRLLYDPKLAAWFCRNILFSYHPKVIQIPMGQTDRYFGYEWLASLKRLSDQKPFPKKHLLYMNFLPREYGDRNKVIRLFAEEPYCFSRNRKDLSYFPVPKEDYYVELAESEFALSPYGLETDCVRTWEALSLDCIPIVEHTFLDPLFDNLPVLIVHDWEEINEPFLKEQKERLKTRKCDKAFFGYWEKLLLDTQKKVRKGDLSKSAVEATAISPQDLEDLFAILESTGKDQLIYRGFLSGVHALQTAAAPFLKKIQLYDLWASQKVVEPYLKDKTLLKHQRKISHPPHHSFETLFCPQARHCRPIFFDFSYFRNSLLRDPNLKQMRHNLKEDLADVYTMAESGTLFCGNMHDNEYVAKVLDKLSSQLKLSINKRGAFWFFVK